MRNHRHKLKHLRSDLDRIHHRILFLGAKIHKIEIHDSLLFFDSFHKKLYKFLFSLQFMILLLLLTIYFFNFLKFTFMINFTDLKQYFNLHMTN